MDTDPSSPSAAPRQVDADKHGSEWICFISALTKTFLEMVHIYSNIENLVLSAGSEKIGCAVTICRGMMENWNAGILGKAK